MGWSGCYLRPDLFLDHLTVITTRNGETIKIPLGNYDYRLKVVNNHNIKKHRQRWLSSNNRISSDVNVCPKNIGIASHREKKTSPLHSHKKLTIDQAEIGTKCFFPQPTYCPANCVRGEGRRLIYITIQAILPI